MIKNPAFANTKITLLDPWAFEANSSPPTSTTQSRANPGAANFDSSRIIRTEYPSSAYAALARESQSRWRAEWGRDNRYHEKPLMLVAEGSSMKLPQTNGETVNYVKNAYDRSWELSGHSTEKVHLVDSPSAIRKALGVPVKEVREVGEDENVLRGYISENCGWADSSASMAYLRQEVVKSNRVTIVTGTVTDLLFTADADTRTVRGVLLSNSTALCADLVLLAAGAHTPQILRTPALCDVYSEVIAYIQLTPTEVSLLASRGAPTLVNAHRGLFTVGPDNNGTFKLGRFSYSGFVDVRLSAGIADTVAPRDRTFEQTASKEMFGWGEDVLEPEGSAEMSPDAADTLGKYRSFLKEIFGPFPGEEEDELSSISTRPFLKVHRCWYTDTPSTDFIADYHPSYGTSLFVATGGSDHAFKFLPVIGERVSEIVLRGGVVPEKEEQEEALEELCHLWRFPREVI